MLKGALSACFLAGKARMYADVVNDKCFILSNCIGNIDGTVLGIERPGPNDEQNAAYNGQKCKHALKDQTICTSNDLILLVYGPKEVCRHDWALYVRKNTEQHLDNVCILDGEQNDIHGESGHNFRAVVDVPFFGSNLSLAASAANYETASVRVTVKRM